MLNPATDGRRHRSDEFVERERLRTDGVDDDIIVVVPGIDGEAGHVIDEHRSHVVIAGASDGEDRQPAREPGGTTPEPATGSSWVTPSM